MSLAALRDLFARVRGAQTGVWRLGQDPHRTLYLERGQIVFAQSTHPLDRLTHLLVEKGKLTQAQMDYAMDNLAPGLSIGRNLIQMGFITQRDLLDIARFQVERVVWGALGSDGADARFESQDLDASVVRLALDTPALLLGGLLNLRDRERLLDVLGPLDQVLTLRSAPREGVLPPDLARLPALLDGRRSLLDLAREASTEPVRVGALALFLKELGWAEALPPEGAPGLAPAPPAAPEPEALVVVAPPALEEPPGLTETRPIPAQPSPAEEPARRPSLIEHIQAAQLPTANLDRMAEQLDRVLDPAAAAPPGRREPPRRDDDEITAENPVPPDLPETHEDAAWHVEEGQALLPEPAQAPPEGGAPEEPPLPLRLEPLEPGPEPFPELPTPPAPSEAPDFRPHHRRGSRKPSLLLLSLPFLAVLGLAWWVFRSTPPAEPLPSPLPPPGASKAGTPAPSAGPGPGEGPAGPRPAGPDLKPAGTELKPPPAPPTEPQPAAPPPAEPKPAAPGAELRWSTLRAGKVEQALAQGRAHLKTLPQGRWILRLEIACQAETLRNAAAWMEPRSKDLFILPMDLRSGQTCNQLFLGSFGSRGEAEAEIAKLPPPFREGGNKPRAFQVSEIPTRQ
ncbi:MAG: hypothetical protein U0P81_15155 [Holophagaceae bacterium]